MATVLLLWGAPAAGKTTVARSVLDGYRARTGRVLPRLGTDEIRKAILGEAFIAEVRNAVYDGIVSIVERVTTDGLDVLVDGNYIDGWRRRQLVDVCARTSARFVSAHIWCALDERLQRNSSRTGVDAVPEVWVRQAHSLAEQCRDDCDLVIDGAIEPPQEAAARLLSTLLPP